jgi:hypothetical protein
MKIALIIIASAMICSTAVTLARESAHWRFSGKPGEVPSADELSPRGALDFRAQLQSPNGAIRVSAETAHAFVYDPIEGRSHPVETSLEFRPSGNQPRFVVAGVPEATGSFTIEILARNSEELPKPHGRQLTLLMLRSGDGSTAAELMIFGEHGYNWWGGAVRQDGRVRTMARVRYNGISHARQPVWRHLALVYDAETRTATTYLDYFRQQSVSLDRPLSFVDAKLYIGDEPGNETERRFIGQISDARFRPEAVKPWHFIRATPHNLSNVSFEPRPGLLPEGSGYMDVRLQYGAVGDGKHDDTHAFRRAFRELQDRVPIEYHTLYVPEGTYLLTKPISWTRFFKVQGAGAGKTVLRAADNAAAFGDPAQPDALLYVGWETWRDRANGQGSAGNAIGSYLFDLTIDTGRGNPGAVALSFHSNNHGSIENVAIRSGDGAGHRGLDFSMKWPGPTLIKNVSVDGYDTGIYARAGEYSLVFENITLRNQRQVAVLNDGNILSIRRLKSHNRVPAVRTGGWGMVTLIDSELEGPEGLDLPAILNDNNGALYVRNLRVAGYAEAISSDGRKASSGHVSEFLAGSPQSLFNAAARTLNLPIEDAPVIPLAEGKVRWANVLDFTQEDKPADWAPAILGAMNSGAEGIFFPANEGDGYRVGSTIEIPGHVRYVLGMRNGIGRREGLDGPTLRISEQSEQPIIFERIHIDGMPTSAGKDPKHPAFEHVSGRTVVFRHNGPRLYQARPGAGHLFVESAEGYWRFARGQKAWGRQMNPESHHVSELINDGADVWILGLKTEYATTKVVNRNGGRLEVLGGFLYTVTKAPPDMPMVINQDAAMSMIFSTSAYQHDHRIYFRDTQQGQTFELLNRQIDSKGPRRHVHLYTSAPPP